MATPRLAARLVGSAYSSQSLGNPNRRCILCLARVTLAADACMSMPFLSMLGEHQGDALQRRNNRLALTPPKPNPFDSANSMGIGRAVVPTRSRPAAASSG